VKLALVLLGACFILFPALGAASLERAEIYFLDGARAMVEGGDWLVPHYQTRAFFDKPPLTYWLMALCFELFGVSKGAGRLVPAVAALLLLLVTFWLGRLLLDRRAGLAAMIILATSVGFMSLGRLAMSDMLLALFSTLAVALGVKLRDGSAPWALPVLGAVLGLGFLNKGPIAVLLPGLGLALLAWPRRREQLPSPRLLALAVALFGLLGFAWFAAIYVRLGVEPLVHFFLRENLERFAASTYDAGQPFLFYLGAYLSVGAPWSAFFALAAARAWRPPDVVVPGAAAARFLLLWIALMLVPLSLSRGKIDYYLLPLLPAFSLVLGRHFAQVRWGRLERLWAAVSLILAAAALALVPLALQQIPDGWISPGRRLCLGAVAALGALALLAAARRPSPRRTLSALAAVSGAVAIAVVTLLVPGFVAAQPNRGVVERVEREFARRRELGVVSCQDPARVQRDILFFTRHAVVERCDLWQVVSGRRPMLLLLQENEYQSLQAWPRLRLVSVHDYVPSASLSLDKLGRGQAARLFLVANYPGPRYQEQQVGPSRRHKEFMKLLRQRRRKRRG
jgi:dolichol-phosphate mannosyltransferase